jgi:hypothetical protein
MLNPLRENVEFFEVFEGIPSNGLFAVVYDGGL